MQGGRLDWGIKSSFQSYVTGPIANGSFSLTGGAATVGGSQFRFHSATGTYDGGSGAFNAVASPAVSTSSGHKKDDGTYQLDLTISRPTVRLSGDGGTLYVDVISKAKGTGAVTTSSQVPFASLSLGGINMKGGGNAVRSEQPSRHPHRPGRQVLRRVLHGRHRPRPGEPLGGRQGRARAAEPSTHAVPVRRPSPRPKKETSGRIEDGAVDWGVRRTFREYVTGSIAKGKWTLTDGAEDGGALFRFPEGTGTYDEKKQTLDATFAGAVRFTGDQGLDLRLGALRANVADDGKGTLYADVTSASGADRTHDGTKKVPLVTFTAKDLKPKDGLAQLTEAPAKLTADGAKAFGGMYKAGTEMDPVSLAVALTDDAATARPARPGQRRVGHPGGRGRRHRRRAEPRTEATASDSDVAPSCPSASRPASLLAVAAASLVIVRRRRRPPRPPRRPDAERTAPLRELTHVRSRTVPHVPRAAPPIPWTPARLRAAGLRRTHCAHPRSPRPWPPPRADAASVALAAACATAVTLGATALAATYRVRRRSPAQGLRVDLGHQAVVPHVRDRMAAGSFTPEGGATPGRGQRRVHLRQRHRHLRLRAPTPWRSASRAA